jgi:hypothetical protein
VGDSDAVASSVTMRRYRLLMAEAGSGPTVVRNGEVS